jgi:photosystem II stability/assembly factor-like uncharacterized protein
LVCLSVVVGVLWPIPVRAAGPIRWTQTGGPLGGPIFALAAHPGNSDVVFAGALNGVYKSTDSGLTWIRLAQGQLDCQEIRVLAIDPLDANTIYAGGNEGLFRSTDSGNSWVQLGSGLTSDLTLSLAIHPLQPEMLYVGGDGPVFRSVDRGDHWAAAGNGLPETRIWSLAIDPSEPRIIYAGTDQGLYQTDNGADGWHPSGRGLPEDERIQVVVVDPAMTRRVFVGTQQGLFRSTDGGANWVPFATFGGADSVSAIILDPLDENTIYTNAGLRCLCKSVDGGVSWVRLNATEGDGPIFVMAIDPRDSRRLYVGTAHGLYRSMDGGQTWAASNAGLVDSEVTLLLDVPGTKGNLFAATRWGVYQTLDGGETWQERNHGLDDLDVISLALDPIDPQHLYASTSAGGIYRSTDGGETWVLAHGPLVEGAQITGMVIGWRQTAGEVPTIIYAGTDGAGVWRSLDFGASWERLAAGLPESHIGAIWLSPREQRFVYVGAGKEVYRLPVSADLAEMLIWRRVTEQPLGGHITSGLVEPGPHGGIIVATANGDVYRGERDGTRWTSLTRDSLPSNLRVEGLAAVSRGSRALHLYAITNGGLFSSSDGGRTWSLNSFSCLQRAIIRSVAVDDRQPERLYVGTARAGVYRGRDMAARMTSWVAYGLALIVVVALLVAGETGRRYLAKRLLLRQSKELDQNWSAWNQIIADALEAHDSVTSEMLSAIPPQARTITMRRYIDAHRDLDLVFQEESQTIVPANHLKLQHFADSWDSLVERLDSVKRAAPIAAHITELLCELLGFSPLENRTFKSLFGYMVKAPAVRLSIPPRFPVVFLLGREVEEEDIRDVRDLMSVLNVTSFFALLVVIDETPERRERARELRRLVRGSSDDFIVLDYQDLRSLFLASDAERRLIEMILAQVDLTVVSPYVISGPVPENMFFGRDYELKAIMRTIRDRSFAIVGGRKIGKTSILTKVHRLIEQTAGFMPFYLDCQHVVSHEEFFAALAILCQVEVDTSSPEVLRRIILRVRRQRNEGTVVLLFDEVDNMLGYDMQHQMHLFRVLRAVSQEGLCRFVFCGERRLNSALHDPDSPLFNFASTMRLSYLTEHDARRVIQEPMATMGVAFEDSDALLKGIIELSSCHPNLVQAICQMLIVRVNARGDRIIRMDDLSAVRASDEFRDFYFEVAWGNATALERLISLLMVGRPSFTASDVRQTLAAHGCTASNTAVDVALDGLGLFSLIKKQGNLYTFESKSFPVITAESHFAEVFTEGLLEELRAGKRAQ